MLDFAAARRMMVDGQVRTSDVTDLRIIAAMLEVPRERFVAPAQAELAYLDLDVPAGEGASHRRLLKPMVVAKMLQAAALRESDRVLDIGCATGYSSALLSRLAGSVVALEEDAALARFAERALGEAAAANVTVVRGPLTAGWPSGGPYDAILLNGMVEQLPQALRAQLKEGGRLIAIRGTNPPGRATLYRSAVGEGWPLFDAAAPALPGFAKPPSFVF